MNKKLFIIALILILIATGVVIYNCTIKRNNSITNTANDGNLNVANNRVLIKSGNIQNENLLDEFINFNRKDYKLLEIEDESGITKLEFIKQEIQTEVKNEDGLTTVNIPEYNGIMSSIFDVEYAKKYYGYYKVTYPDGTTLEYSPLSYNIKKRIDNNKVIVYFNIFLQEVDIAKTDDLKVLCEYNLSSSNYKKTFNLSYNQRKDLGIKKIAEKNEFDNENYAIYTYGGDADITVEGDMVYNLKQALQDKIITAEDILNQAKMDLSYGLCEEHFYSDGGSIEYCYNSYTILKYNTLNGNQDLYIGMKGAIINKIDK